MKPVTNTICHYLVLDIRCKLSATDFVKCNVGHIKHTVADIVNVLLFNILRQTYNVGVYVHNI